MIEEKEIDCICILCDKHYIYNIKHRKGHTLTKCGSCMVNIRRFNVKDKAIIYKGGKCIICGYSKCKRALVFHHVDESKKSFSISGHHCRKWENIKKELDKTILLCCRCHDELHDGFVSIDYITL